MDAANGGTHDIFSAILDMKIRSNIKMSGSF